MANDVEVEELAADVDQLVQREKTNIQQLKADGGIAKFDSSTEQGQGNVAKTDGAAKEEKEESEGSGYFTYALIAAALVVAGGVTYKLLQKK